MTLVRRAAAAVALAAFSITLFASAPAQAAGDTSWGGYSVKPTVVR